MDWQDLTPEQRAVRREEFAKNCNVCGRCGAFFLGSTHIWSGNLTPGNAMDLAGLVCNPVDDPRCINPCKGQKGGQTWEDRQRFLDGAVLHPEISEVLL